MDESTQTSRNPLFKGKPLIQNATRPNQLFTKGENETLKQCLENQYAKDRGWKEKQPSEQEKANMANLLELARFHGYYPRRIDENGKIKWACMIYQPNRKRSQIIISIIACAECGVNFHSHHYEDERSYTLCEKCRPKKPENAIIPPELKSILRTKNDDLTKIQCEDRILEINNDEIPF